MPDGMSHYSRARLLDAPSMYIYGCNKFKPYSVSVLWLIGYIRQLILENSRSVEKVYKRAIDRDKAVNWCDMGYLIRLEPGRMTA